MSDEPKRIRKLPVDKHGRPVPWFVAWIDGVPDFRVVGAGRMRHAIRLGLCWVCGEPLGAYRTFVIGPMCAVNRVSAEPPSHKDCAVYSATHCPFLTTPNMVRRDKHLPDDAEPPAGVMIDRNPGVALVWTTKTSSVFSADGGVLFDIGEPTQTAWFAHGRAATRAEVLESIDSGLPILVEIAEAEGGPAAVADLEAMHAAALLHIPAVAS